MKLKELDEARENLKKANKELLEAEEKLMALMPIISRHEFDKDGWEIKSRQACSLSLADGIAYEYLLGKQRDADLGRHYEIVGEIFDELEEFASLTREWLARFRRMGGLEKEAKETDMGIEISVASFNKLKQKYLPKEEK